MSTCLNVLGEPEVFIPTAALLALVLLVRAQLYTTVRTQLYTTGGIQTEDINGVMGLFWIYLALFFALVAVAVLFFNVNCAKGFLILAFFMTVTSILTVLLQNIRHIRHICNPSRKPLRSLSVKYPRKKFWVSAWLALLIGLVLISFSVANELTGLPWICCFYIGKVMVVIVFICAGKKVVKDLCKKNDC